MVDYIPFFFALEKYIVDNNWAGQTLMNSSTATVTGGVGHVYLYPVLATTNYMIRGRGI